MFPLQTNTMKYDWLTECFLKAEDIKRGGKKLLCLNILGVFLCKSFAKKVITWGLSCLLYLKSQSNLCDITLYTVKLYVHKCTH